MRQKALKRSSPSWVKSSLTRSLASNHGRAGYRAAAATLMGYPTQTPPTAHPTLSTNPLDFTLPHYPVHLSICKAPGSNYIRFVPTYFAFVICEGLPAAEQASPRGGGEGRAWVYFKSLPWESRVTMVALPFVAHSLSHSPRAS